MAFNAREAAGPSDSAPPAVSSGFDAVRAGVPGLAASVPWLVHPRFEADEAGWGQPVADRPPSSD